MPVLSLDGQPVATPAAFVDFADLPEEGAEPGAGAGLALDLPNTAAVAELAPPLARAALIRIAFPGFADGRGFSLARRLRDLGYGGRLRAAGALIPDQRALARACGFDEIEVAPALFHRQGGEAAWVSEAALPPFRRRAAARGVGLPAAML